MDAHFEMVPPFRRKLIKEARLKAKDAKRAGVMALFYPDGEKMTRLLLIHRNEYPGVHSNQIGFPGGKMEQSDENLVQTALRETHEEVGVSPDAVEVVAELSDVYIPPSNFLVTPFLGLYANPKKFVIDTAEVQQLVEVRFDDFLDESNLMTQQISTSYAQNVKVPAFNLNGFVVWGATAMMLSEIKQLLRQVL